ncbi:MAG: TonB-dependent receptor [Hyphomonadaceae bacterium]|nr:TonB-dependent receptor [Hyphomonadaceae bacterium]
MKTACRTALLTSAALALAFPAFPQSAPPDEGDVVVVTGSATPVEYEKVGSSLTVIGEELIEDQGYSYVPDVLRQVPGLAVNQAGAAGSLTQVRIRGAEGNHTLVLLDGIDVSSPDQGETDFSTLLSGDIERIEVLRGPQSGLYGSNALAGVVNLITRRKVDGHYVNASIEAGEFSTVQLQGNTGFGNGEDYASVGFHLLTTDGYDVSPDTTAQGVPAVGLGGVPGDTEGNKVATVYLRGGKAFSPVFRVDGIARYLNKDSDLDGQAFNFPIAGDSYDDASEAELQQFLAGASTTLSLLDGRWETVGSASYVDEKRRGKGTSFPFLTGPALPTPAQLNVPMSSSGADATRTKLALQSTIEFGAPSFLSFLTGFVEGKEETYSDPFAARDEERELLGVGLQYRGEFAEQVYLSATARHDDNRGDFEDADTYSVALSWVIPGIGTRPHGSIGTGITNPTFFEQFGFNPGSFVGNPDLLPEEAEGWDIGVEQTLLDGRVVLDLTYFESTLENEIFTSFGPPPNFLSTPANRTTQSDRSGWEATFRVYPTDTIDIVGSYTSLDATEPAGIEVRRPESQAGLDASWRVSGGPFQLNLGVSYNGEQIDTDFGTFLRTAQDPYTLVRLGASYQLNDTTEIYGRIENLTDEDYEEVIGYRGQPQAIFVGVRFRDGTTK